MWYLLIPPIAVLLTVLWIYLRGRSARTPEALITIEGYRRGLAALARPIESSPQPQPKTVLGTAPADEPAD